MDTKKLLAAAGTRAHQVNETKRIDNLRRKTKNERQINLAYERAHRLIAVLTEEDFRDIIGENWSDFPIEKFDVSGEKYQLEVLDGMSGGLMHPDLKKQKLWFVDVSFNRLRDINVFQDTKGFTALTVLMARRNVISHEPKLCLPKLLELNLSHNQLKNLPPLKELPSLQVLILSHNKLTGSFENLKTCKRLERVDLAYNQYDLTPAQLSMCLDALNTLVSLSSLRLYENPFVAYIKQYQFFVLKKLPGLSKLDNVKITPGMRAELDAQDRDHDFKTLEDYQDTLNLRREEYKRKQGKKHEKEDTDQRLTTLPELSKMIAKLEDIMEDSGCLLENVSWLLNLSKAMCQRMQISDEESKAVLAIFWNTYTKDSSANSVFEIEAAIDQFMELVVGIMERHDTARADLTDTLGYLAGLPVNRFGFKCMSLLGRLMTSSTTSKDEVTSTLKRVVVHGLITLPSDTLSTPYCEEIINGLVQMFKIEDIISDVGQVVTPLLPSFAKTFGEHQGEKSASVKNSARLLAYATDHEACVEKIGTEDLANHCIFSLDNRSLQDAEQMQEYWLDVLRLAKNLVEHGEDAVFQIFYKAGLHARIISRMKVIRAEGKYLEEQETSEADGVGEGSGDAAILAKSIDFVRAMSKKKPEILHESCKSYRIQKELTEMVKMHKQDKSILAASIRMLTLILEDREMYSSYASFIISECSKFKPMLQYLGGKKFGDLFKDEKSKVPLSGIPAGSVINDVFVAVIDLISFFARRQREESEEDDDGQAETVNDYLNREDREAVLLSCLSVPNDNVKFAVMRCMDQISIDQLEPNEISLMIKFIADCQNISAGQTEDILALIVNVLGKIAGNRSKTGDAFREHKAEEALVKCYNLLHENAMRPTFSEDEQGQKILLGVSIVKFFRGCSKHVCLHKIMRADHIENTLSQILQLEQQLNDPLRLDIAVEQTWMGRSITFLMRCFRADASALKRGHKVTFRVLSRIADVLEGRTDGFRNDYETSCSFQEIAARECRNWSEGAVLKGLRYNDDNEWKDRLLEAQYFLNMDGLRKLIDFMLDDECQGYIRGFQARMAQAAEKMAKMKGNAEDKKRAVEQEQKNKKALAAIQVVEGMDDDDEEDLHTSGRALLMECMQSLDEIVDEDDDCMFVSPPQTFEIREGLHDMENYEKNIKVYVIAALLRIIWALLTVPPTQELRTETIRVVREPKTIMSLMALMQNKPMLSCNLAAKFLNVMTSALDIGVFGSPKALQRIESCKLLTEYIHEISGMSDGLMKLLKIAKDKPLRPREQHLCSEIARMMGMITRVVPYFKQDLFTECEEAQEEGIAKCIDWIIPPELTRINIGMILYELQMDAGAGSGKINQEFVRLAYQKAGMKDRATRFIAQLILRCPDRKYDILEAFNAAQVFENQEVRPSYILALLGEVNLSFFTKVIANKLVEWSGESHDRVIQLALVEVPFDTKNGCFTGILCASTLKLYLMRPSDLKPAYKNDNDGNRWDPSWEVAYPRDPVMVWSRSYSQIKRIYRCYGTQMMALEWYTVDEMVRMNSSNKKELNPQQLQQITDKENVFVFHREQDRERFVTCLRRFEKQSEKSEKDQSVETPIFNDSVIRNLVLEQTGKSQVLAATCAMPLQESLLGLGDSPIESVYLFVLTTKKIIRFSTSLQNFVPPDDEAEYFDEDTFQPPDIAGQSEIYEFADNEAGGKSESDYIKAHYYRTVLKEGQKSTHSVRTSSSPVLHMDKDWQLPPKDVIFNNAADQPDLKINTSNGTCSIRFYDDAGRESWRRALAYYLTKYVSKNGKLWGRSR